MALLKSLYPASNASAFAPVHVVLASWLCAASTVPSPEDAVFVEAKPDRGHRRSQQLRRARAYAQIAPQFVPWSGADLLSRLFAHAARSERSEIVGFLRATRDELSHDAVL